MQVTGYGRLQAEISFLAGNLREAVLMRNEEHLQRSRYAAAVLRDAAVTTASADSFTREQWELLHAVSESLDRAHSAEQPLDHLALSDFAPELILLEALAR